MYFIVHAAFVRIKLMMMMIVIWILASLFWNTVYNQNGLKSTFHGASFHKLTAPSHFPYFYRPVDPLTHNQQKVQIVQCSLFSERVPTLAVLSALMCSKYYVTVMAHSMSAGLCWEDSYCMWKNIGIRVDMCRWRLSLSSGTRVSDTARDRRDDACVCMCRAVGLWESCHSQTSSWSTARRLWLWRPLVP